ncbi:nucleolar complex protein 2 homolog [Macadamia integrifolia]|uniref:nucleolar complex protein 2 homolog n=1 Tax=Macadamia integrifolia TaxID=60698 RepID=UPI001C53218D|nr:nucleolar complex protein 2 homolog [Macadamia integrifolia]XP_042478493.1 nucleolar complex protein 2 homolog [Macadamia integrifolia]XP_042478494.1 nucleolar complex protein 2 homolog [Macadamia integrifolia]XP_042478495.1 nucleolar complex protein 2 homolog [Macadamia integrifolia]
MSAQDSASYDEDEVMEEEEEKEEEMEEAKAPISKSRKKAGEHMEQLQRLQEKDPEFYEFLKVHDKELLEFEDDIDQDTETDVDELQENAETDMHDKEHQAGVGRIVQEPTKNVITMATVDSWCSAIKENSKLSAVRSLMRAFRTACHHGDDGGDEPSSKFSILSSSVFNKIMLFVLNEMDAILRRLLKFPASGGKKESIINLKSTRQWKNHGNLVKSYLGNALHVLNQMTDTEMISFTLRRLRYSSVFLAAFPSFLRKYIKVTLHFWGTGGGALPVVSFLFIRDLCIRLGADCLDEFFKGVYKGYVLNCQSVNAMKLQHLQFLANCVTELCGVDLPTAYQHAFVFIRQLAMILREALNMKTKESYKKVYGWKFMSCLELWTGAICAYSSEPDFQPLAYPLTQIISGVARMVPTARYFPLRLRCARMLNRIAACTCTFVPVSFLLLDMLEMKELNRRPTGGVGKAVDLRTLLKVQKPVLKTRAFQEACVFSVIEELAEHLAQWSYSIAFFELAFIPTVRLRSFCKTTKIERFRREIRELISQIEANAEFTNARRTNVSFLPNDPAAAAFLEAEKESGASPLSQYVVTLRQKAQQRSDSMVESSVIVGAHSSVFDRKKSESDDDDDVQDKEEGAAVFSSSSWLPGSSIKSEDPKQVKTKKRKRELKQQDEVALVEDVVGDLVLSSDEDDSISDTAFVEEEEEEEDESRLVSSKRGTQKQKYFKDSSSKNKGHSHGKKPKKRKRAKQAK